MGHEVKTFETGQDLRIYLASRNTIQTLVLRDYLAAELAAHCTIHSDLTTCMNAATLNPAPTIVLFDCSVFDFKGILEHLVRSPGVASHVIQAFFNVEPDRAVEREAVKAGIRGFFYANQDPAQLVKGIRTIATGDVWISRRVLLDAAMQKDSAPAAPAAPRNGCENLSQRETEILAMMVVGARNDEIAEELYISTNTVKTHIYNIYKKIRVPNRTQAALWAAKHL
jgi:DNA-binding NarL/FixJ family response regulator